MVKQIWRYFTFAIGWGSFIMALNILFLYFRDTEGFEHFMSDPLTFVIGHFIIGVGFFGTAIVYEINRLSFRLKLIIHVIVGIGLFLLVSFKFGWGIVESPASLIQNVVAYVGIIFVVWVALYLRDKKEVEEINRTLREQNHKKPLDTE